MADFLEAEGIEIPAKSIPAYANIDLGKYRIDYVKKLLADVAPNASSANWGNIKEEDSEYSGYTSASITGDDAQTIGIKLIEAANSGDLTMAQEKRNALSDENDKILRFSAPGNPNFQIFFFDAKGNKPDEVVLVVRPIEVQKQVTIVI